MFVYQPDVVNKALALRAAGATLEQTAVSTGASISAIRRWGRGRLPHSHERSPRYDPPPIDRLAPAAYAYVLGLYLGDGHVVRSAKSWLLAIYMDSAYPGIVLEACEAIMTIRGGSAPRVKSRGDSRCVAAPSQWRHWPAVLPQHGPGRKHHRAIALTDWQTQLTTVTPEAFVRGLIHSDGSRYVANQRVGGKVYRYSRYEFANRSEDIKRIFCDHLDLLGIGWTRPNAMSIAIARRADVAALDRFVGPKR